MEKETSEDRARLSAIVQSSEDAIISKKLDGTITSWNPAAEKIFDFKADEAIGKHISIIIPDDLLDEEAEILSSIKEGNRIDHYETIRKRKDGTRILISLAVSPIKNDKGNVIGASKIARDITIQKTAEEKQAILAAIVDSSDDAIVSKTLDGIITSWNNSAQKMFGYNEREAIGKHISIIIPIERIDEEKVIIENIRKGKKVNHFETVRRTKGGTEINISLTVSPVLNQFGKVIGASKVARDITEKIELEKQQKLYTEKLKELNNYKDEFMAMASHELKTPLTVIKANLQILEYKLISDPNIGFINKTLQSVNKLSNLIASLLDVSKIQSGKLELNISKFDMTALLKETMESIQQTSPDHSITFENREKLIVIADRERIEQVIVNLLTNAVKYSPYADKISVEAYLKDETIEVCVRDEGIGIPKGDIDKIFTRFFRVQGIASTFSGSGIGLYISSEIIKRHGGDMWVQSEVGKGSAFYFSVPCKVKR
jgi:PAS domain S-box-containing protein